MPRLSPEERTALAQKARWCDQKAFDTLWDDSEGGIRGFFRLHLSQASFTNQTLLDKLLKQTREEALRRKARAREDGFYEWLTDQALTPLIELRLQSLKTVDLQDLLCLLVLGGATDVDSPPHQVLTFLFETFLKYEPERIIQELSDIPLSELAQRAENECINTRFNNLEPIIVIPYFQPLHEAMAKMVGELDWPIQFLFTVDSTFQTDLNCNRIPARLPGDFKTKGIQLSGNVMISTKKNSSRWLIADLDREKVYTLKKLKEGEKINVYAPQEPPQGPPPPPLTGTVGNTKMSEYYRSDPNHQIYNWLPRVRQKVVGHLKKKVEELKMLWKDFQPLLEVIFNDP